MAKVTDQNTLLGNEIDAADVFYVVDVDDTTDSASGTGKKITLSELESGLSVSLTNIEDIATDSILGRDTAGDGEPEVLGASQVRTILGLGSVYDKDTGTDPGDVPLNGGAASFTSLGLTGNLEIENGTPQVILSESDGTSTHNKTRLVQALDDTVFQTLDDGGAFVASDYIIRKSASGAEDQEWRLLNVNKMKLDSNGLDIVDGITAGGTIALNQSAGDIVIRDTAATEDQLTLTTSGANGFLFTKYDLNLRAGASSALKFDINGVEATRIDSTRSQLWGKTGQDTSSEGVEIAPSGRFRATLSDGDVATFNRLTSDGILISLRQDTTQEGSISVSGTTVSYNGAHLSRWSQWADGPHAEPPEVYRGTILSNTDEMCVWLAVEWEEVVPAEVEKVTHYKTKPVKKKKITHEVVDGKAVQTVEEITVDEVQKETFPIYDELGNPVTEPEKVPIMEDGEQVKDDEGNPVFEIVQVQKYFTRRIVDYVEEVERTPEQVVKHHELYDGPGEVGDVIDYTAESGEVVKATIVQEANEQLNKTLISSVVGDKSVAGVFQDYDKDDVYAPYDFYVAQVGDFVIRIGKDVKLKNGDLIESAGDGTGRVQKSMMTRDYTVKASTVAKITSTEVIETYSDGSYLVPCVLMAS
jgi:hypothetical protein